MHPISIDDIHYVIGEERIDIKNSIKNGDKVIERTGIETVFRTKKEAEDLALNTAKEILKKNNFNPECLIYVTQSQKYILPGSSVLLHNLLNLNSSCAVYDINAGCSGFAQALLLASNLIKQYKKILIICSDTYRKKLNVDDRSTMSVFSDAASSILISDKPKIKIEKVINKIDGGKHHMLVQKNPTDKNSSNCLYMSGRELWNFTRLEVVPDIIKALNYLKEINFYTKDIFIHQASKVVVDGIKKELLNLDNKLLIHENYQKKGNTVSSTLPILLKNSNFNYNDSNYILSGFGVGLISCTLAIRKFSEK